MKKRESKEEKNDSIAAIKNAKNALTSANKPISVSTRIRKIGNSKGILLNNSILRELGVEDDAEVMVMAEKGQIIIKPVERKRKINTDLSTGEAQFKAAIKNGDKPEPDMFEGMENNFDKEEW